MRSRSLRITRWGWMATTLALVVALLATAWASQRGAARASDTLVRGQSDVLMEAFREFMRARQGVPSAATIDSFVADRRDAGVRYVGIRIGRDDPIEAGVPLGDPPPRDEGGRGGRGGGGRGAPPGPRAIGDRVRMESPVLICADPPCAGRSGFAPASAVLEFEPVVAEELTASASRTFFVASIVAAALLAAALAFFRLSLLREQAQHRVEQERRLASLGEMSAVLAHEIRNPLASLKGAAQLLVERRGMDEGEHRKAERIVTEAKRLEALIADLLEFARGGKLELAPTDPGTLLKESLDEVGRDAFRLRLAEVPPWPLDADHMRRALTNLLRNAAQASPAGTKSEIGLAVHGDELVFTIRDFGPGIPAGEESRIFEPFYTTRTTGTGLGLAVARRIAELHDGRITASNHPAGGAVFEIVIPRP